MADREADKKRKKRKKRKKKKQQGQLELLEARRVPEIRAASPKKATPATPPRKYRRDEIAAVLRWARANEYDMPTIDEIATKLGLTKYLDPAADYNYPGDTDTSRQASWSQLPRSGTQRRRVLEALTDFPRSDEEIAKDMRISQNSARPRRHELVCGGWVEDTGTRVTTADGELAIVWGPTAMALKHPDLAR